MSDAVIAELLDMGFDRLKVLRVCTSGSVDLSTALEALLAEMDQPHVGGDGTTEKVLVLGISQYTFRESGASACSSICASALVFLLRHYNGGSNGDLNESTLGDAVTAGVVAHSDLATTGEDLSAHLSVEDVIRLRPDIEMQLKKVNTDDAPLQGLVSDASAFDRLLDAAARLAPDASKALGVVVTKPPETILLIMVDDDKFVLFDPHSRPQLGLDGAYLVESQRRDHIVARLRTLFPSCEGLGGGMAVEAYSAFELSVYQLERAT